MRCLMLTPPGGRKYLGASVEGFFAGGGSGLWVMALSDCCDAAILPRQRVTLALMKALRMFPGQDVIIFEDDLQFAGDFWQEASAVIETARIASMAAVSFYVPSGRRRRCKASGLPGLLVYPPKAYYGTQAIWYNHLTAAAFGQWLWDRKDRIGEPDFPFDTDGELRRWLLATPDATLYATERDLVQHVGTDSLIPSSLPHQAGAFKP